MKIRLGVLFSGGKDSTLALMKAMEKENVVCLVSIISENPFSYMFHTPNINLVKMQADAIGLPIIIKKTKGEKEKEVKDLYYGLKKAKEIYKIEGVVSGAVASIYQAERIEKICDKLDLYCFHPLWLRDQEELLKEVIKKKFKVIISGIFAYPLNEKWLGREINKKTLKELLNLRKEYGINIAGEGGEFETFVLDCPIFKKRIIVEKAEKTTYDENSGIFLIKSARLESKEKKKRKGRKNEGEK